MEWIPFKDLHYGLGHQGGVTVVLQEVVIQ